MHTCLVVTNTSNCVIKLQLKMQSESLRCKNGPTA